MTALEKDFSDVCRVSSVSQRGPSWESVINAYYNLTPFLIIRFFGGMFFLFDGQSINIGHLLDSATFF